MKELFFRNAGAALIPNNEEAEDALRQYPNGVTLRVKVVQPRSTPHNNFFFAFLKEAFEQWPETHAFQPTDYNDHLRAWLLVKAGFSNGVDLRPRTEQEARATVAALKLVVRELAGGRPFWTKITVDYGGGLIEVRWPKSIAFDRIDEEEFRRITTVIFAVIYAETGLDVEDHYQRYLEKHPALKVVPTRRVDGRPTGNPGQNQAGGV